MLPAVITSLEKVLSGAKSKGVKIKLILLREKNLKFCTGCDICFGTNKECWLNDSWKEIFNDLMNADLWVLASPNYFDNVTAQMKVFIDRTDPYCSPPKFKDKKAAIVVLGGNSHSNVPCIETLKSFVRIHKMNLVNILDLKADKINEILEKKKDLNKAFKFGEKLTSL